MTNQTESPTGLLTSDEREILTDADTDPEVRDEVLESVQSRLTATLQDFQTLYLTLRDQDLRAVFSPDDSHELSTIRAATQDALALLILGMFLGDDMVETRLADAIRYAALGYDEEVTVNLDIRRGPLPTIEQCIDRFEREGLTEETFALLEYHLWASASDPEKLVTACEHLGIEQQSPSEFDVPEMEFVERIPQTVITNVSVEQHPADREE
jgi:hypothetical protein